MPKDPMGKKRIKDGGPSLTEDDISHMAEGWDMSTLETKNNIYDLLGKQLGKK